MVLYEWYFLFGIIAMVFSIAFSVFMMYVMWRTKEGVKKVSKTIKEQGDNLSQSVDKLLSGALGGLIGGNDTPYIPLEAAKAPDEPLRPTSACCDKILHSVGINDGLIIYCSECETVMDNDGRPTDKKLH